MVEYIEYNEMLRMYLGWYKLAICSNFILLGDFIK